MPRLLGSHDLFIQDTSGSPRRGFMLIKERGQRVYQLEDYRTIAPRVLTEAEFTQAQLPAEVEAVWYQENWQAGIGWQNHRLGLGAYGLQATTDGYGIDTSSTQGILGSPYKVDALTFDNSPGSVPVTGFAKVGTEYWAFAGRYVHSTAFGTVLTRGTTPVNTACIYTNGHPYEGNTYAPRLSWNTTFPASVPLGYIYKADADANWTLSTLEVLLKFMCVADGKLWGAYEATLGADQTLNAALNAAATTVVLTGDTTASITTNDYVIVTHNSATEEIIQITNAGTFAAGETTYTCTRGKYGTTDQNHNNGVTVNEYTLATTNVRSSTDPTNTGSWAAATTIGDTSAPITALVPWYNGVQEVLLVVKEDGLWTMTASGTVELLYDLRNQQRQYNFIGAHSWDGNRRVLLPLTGGGLWEMSEGSIRDISFEQTMPTVTTLHGRVTALASAPDKVYASVMYETGGNSNIEMLVGQLVTIGGQTDYRWHNLRRQFSVSGVTGRTWDVLALCGMDSSGSTIHRLFLGVADNSTGANVAQYYLAKDKDAAYFTTGLVATAQTVVDDRGHPLSNKRYSKVDFTTRNLGTGATAHYIIVYYRVDGGSWTYVTGNVDTSKLTANTQTLTFAAEVTGKTIELLCYFYHPTNSDSSIRAEIWDFRVTAQLRLDTIDMLPCQVYLGEHQRTLNGGLEPLSVAARLSQLETWHDQAAEVTAIDSRGTSRSMVFIKGSWRLREVAHRYGHEPEYVVGFVLAAV